MSRKKTAAIAIITVVAAFGGLVASSDGCQTFVAAENVGSDEGFWPNVTAAENLYLAWLESSIMIAVQ